MTVKLVKFGVILQVEDRGNLDEGMIRKLLQELLSVAAAQGLLTSYEDNSVIKAFSVTHEGTEPC